MRRIIRALAVIALALSPVWGVPSVHAASSLAPAHYPTFPSYYSNGCATAINGYITCGGNGILLTQVNSGYACSALVVSFSGVVVSSQPLVVTVTANSGTFNSNFSVSGDGDYAVNIPGFLVNNLAVVQITASTGGSFFLSNVGVSTCAVPTSTSTANPSDTATNTPVPVTGTPTPIPTFTPIPVVHNTFTPTVTRTGTITPVPPTATVTATGTPVPERDCGSYTFPVLNCDWVGWGGVGGSMPTHWTNLTNTSPQNTLPYCGYTYISSVTPITVDSLCYGTGHYTTTTAYQTVVAGASGALWWDFQSSTSTQLELWVGDVTTSTNSFYDFSGTCPIGGGTFCQWSLATLVAGHTYNVGVETRCDCAPTLYISKFYMPTVPTATPGSTGTFTSTPTVTTTPTPGATFTPTLTPVPIPGAPETAIPTDTECPGGCAVQQLTAIPGMATMVKVDTSPFDPLKNLSLTRSTCAAFGYAQIPYPHIVGTPAYGSTNPISYTWTTDITGPWDNSIVNGSIVVTNTAVQPCAMSEIPTFVWDLTYWLSVIVMAVGWFLWLIGFVGRLSGEETING